MSDSFINNVKHQVIFNLDTDDKNIIFYVDEIQDRDYGLYGYYKEINGFLYIPLCQYNTIKNMLDTIFVSYDVCFCYECELYGVTHIEEKELSYETLDENNRTLCLYISMEYCYDFKPEDIHGIPIRMFDSRMKRLMADCTLVENDEDQHLMLYFLNAIYDFNPYNPMDFVDAFGTTRCLSDPNKIDISFTFDRELVSDIEAVNFSDEEEDIW